MTRYHNPQRGFPCKHCVTCCNPNVINLLSGANVNPLEFHRRWAWPPLLDLTAHQVALVVQAAEEDAVYRCGFKGNAELWRKRRGYRRQRRPLVVALDLVVVDPKHLGGGGCGVELVCQIDVDPITGERAYTLSAEELARRAKANGEWARHKARLAAAQAVEDAEIAAAAAAAQKRLQLLAQKKLFDADPMGFMGMGYLNKLNTRTIT